MLFRSKELLSECATFGLNWLKFVHFLDNSIGLNPHDRAFTTLGQKSPHPMAGYINKIDNLMDFSILQKKITFFWKREDGVKPSRTRRCDRERNLQKPLFDFKREGAGSRVIRKPEDLAENASSTLRGLRGCGFWKTPFLIGTGLFCARFRVFMQKVSSLHSAEGTKK